MQRRAFLVATGVGTVALAGCLDDLFGDDDAGEPTEGETDDPASGGTDGPTDQETDDPGDEPVVVRLRDDQFHPRNLSVEAGATVRWTNADAVEHTVTAASNNWTVDYAVPAGESREYGFQADGVYAAYCRYHGALDLSGMAMKIAVGDAEIDDPLDDDDYPY